MRQNVSKRLKARQWPSTRPLNFGRKQQEKNPLAPTETKIIIVKKGSPKYFGKNSKRSVESSI